MMINKKSIKNFYESDNVIAIAYRFGVNILIVVSIILLLGEYKIISLGLVYIQYIQLDIIIASIFLFDYLLRLYISDKKWNFIKEPLNIIDIIAIVPSFIGFGDTKVLRTFRVLRLLRFLRIIRLIKNFQTEIQDTYTRTSYAEEELIFYKSALGFYHDMKQGDAESDKSIEELLTIVQKESKRINSMSNEDTLGYHNNFRRAYKEIIDQLSAVLKLHHPSGEFSIMKIRYIMCELEQLLNAEHSPGGVPFTDSAGKYKTDINLMSLLQITSRSVLITFSFAIVLSVLFKWTEIDIYLANFTDQLLLAEAGLGALIVFITSFNINYTIRKRTSTDISLICFCNTLNVYAKSIADVFERHESNTKKRNKAYKEMAYFFDAIFFDIIAGTRKGNKYHLKFDTTIFETLDRIQEKLEPYLRESLTDIERTRIEKIQDTVIEDLGSFQTIVNIRTPQIFYLLNSWLIRITYAVLMVIAPYSALPRLILINFMQRAFFVVAQETDSAIFNVSSASLPVVERVSRKACRVNKILCRVR